MSAITTHVLDTSRGRPAAGVPIILEQHSGGDWRELGRGRTDDDGRLRALLAEGVRPEPGTYRLTFDTAEYFKAQGATSFYPVVHIVFAIGAPDEHYHVPLLLSPFGYSTYRGS